MLSTPIVRVGQALIVPVQEHLGDEDVLDLQTALTGLLERQPAAGVVIDLSLVQMIDSFLGRALNEVALAARLLGARTIVAGMQPAVAITLVELGLELRGVETTLTVDRALQRLDGRVARDGRRTT